MFEYFRYSRNLRRLRREQKEISAKYNKQIKEARQEKSRKEVIDAISAEATMQYDIYEMEIDDRRSRLGVWLYYRLRHYNTTRPHSSLGYKPPAPEAILGTLTQPVLAGLS